MEHATLDKIYSKLELLEGRMAKMEYLLVPQEKLSPKELVELKRIETGMAKGGRTKYSKNLF